jgi:hypothetical protein
VGFVQGLLAVKANPFLLNEHGQTAFDLSKNEEILDLLKTCKQEKKVEPSTPSF